MNENDHCNVFVGGIHWRVNEKELKSFFSSYGEVIEVKIIRDRFNNNQSKGYGFVKFKDEKIADEVKSKKFIEYSGKKMNVGGAFRNSTTTTTTTTTPQRLKPTPPQVPQPQQPHNMNLIQQPIFPQPTYDQQLLNGLVPSPTASVNPYLSHFPQNNPIPYMISPNPYQPYPIGGQPHPYAQPYGQFSPHSSMNTVGGQINQNNSSASNDENQSENNGGMKNQNPPNFNNFSNNNMRQPPFQSPYGFHPQQQPQNMQGSPVVQQSQQSFPSNVSPPFNEATKNNNTKEV